MSNEKKYEIIRKIVMGVNQAGNVNITCRGLISPRLITWAFNA